MRPKLRKLALPSVLALGMGGALTLADAARDPVPDLQAQQAAPAAGPEQLAGAFRTASAAAMPAVVHVKVEMGARTVRQDDALRGTPFEEMFGGRGGQMRIPPSASSGSGFIVSPDGYVITNNHVVEGATRVTVVLSDEREFDARVVGRDPNTDIAVLKIDGRNLPTVKMGDPDQLQTGDWVLALGYPLSLGQTTTAGIVSAKGRSIGIMRSTGATAPLEYFIQTDAAINPGNSGGPLIDLQGRVVGVNSAIASPTGYYSGYGFSVPINLARRVADDLMKDGVVHRPMLGVEIRDASAADAEVFRLPAPAGAVVAGQPKAGAAQAGLELGDVIVGVDGHAIRNTGDLMDAVMRKQPGERVALDVVRYGERRKATVRLDEFDTERAPVAAQPAPEGRGANDAWSRIGFSVVQMTPDIARQIRADRADGVVVSGVDPMGPASGQLIRGTVVERLNGRRVETVEELRAAAEAVRPGQVVSILARSPDGSQTIVNYRARS